MAGGVTRPAQCEAAPTLTHGRHKVVCQLPWTSPHSLLQGSKCLLCVLQEHTALIGCCWSGSAAQPGLSALGTPVTSETSPVTVQFIAHMHAGSRTDGNS